MATEKILSPTSLEKLFELVASRDKRYITKNNTTRISFDGENYKDTIDESLLRLGLTSPKDFFLAAHHELTLLKANGSVSGKDFSSYGLVSFCLACLRFFVHVPGKWERKYLDSIVSHLQELGLLDLLPVRSISCYNNRKNRPEGLTRNELRKKVHDSVDFIIEQFESAPNAKRIGIKYLINSSVDQGEVYTKMPIKKCNTNPSLIPNIVKRLGIQEELDYRARKKDTRFARILYRYLRWIEFYYVIKGVRLAPNYLKVISDYLSGTHSDPNSLFFDYPFTNKTGFTHVTEFTEKMFVDPSGNPFLFTSDDFSRHTTATESSWIICHIASLEGFLPRGFLRLKIRSNSNTNYYSERRNDLIKNCSLTPLDLRETFIKQNGLCALSGEKLKFNFWDSCHDLRGTPDECNVSIDRIRHNSPYALGEVQLTSKQANKCKMELDNEEFYALCKKIVKHMGVQRSSSISVEQQLDLLSPSLI